MTPYEHGLAAEIAAEVAAARSSAGGIPVTAADRRPGSASLLSFAAFILALPVGRLVPVTTIATRHVCGHDIISRWVGGYRA